MINESELQKQIIKRIEEDNLYNLIINKETIFNNTDGRYKENFKPYFSINYLIRERYINYGNMILNALDSDLEIINGSEIRSISLDASERLYPDIILYNSDNAKYFILELKRSLKAEREAVTEILGYKLEIKNHLPFINNGDVPMIIVSTEFGDLLLHSIASLLLDNVPVLCLKPIIKNDIFEYFEIMNVTAWTNLKTSGMNSESLSGWTICLYGREDKYISSEEIYDDIIIAVDYIKNDANKIGSHGFCIVWENFNANGVHNPMTTDYFISIFTVNPYSVFYNDIVEQQCKDILTEHIYKTIEETDFKYVPNYSNELLDKNAMRFLKDKYRPTYEMAINFPMFQQYLIKNGSPVYCDVWGDIGDFIRDIYIDPVIKDMLKNQERAYNNPEAFFRLLDYLTNEYTFAKGLDTCGEYLKFGIEFGNLLKWLQVLLRDKNNKSMLNKVRFAFWKISNALQEVEYYFENPPHIKLDLNQIENSIRGIKGFCEWFLKSLDNTTLEHYAFRVGLKYYFMFSEQINFSNIKEELPELYKAYIEEVFALFTKLFMEQINKYRDDEKYILLENLFIDASSKLGIIEWNTFDELISVLLKYSNNNIFNQIMGLNEGEKIQLLKNNLFDLLNTKKACSFDSYKRGKDLNDC